MAHKDLGGHSISYRYNVNGLLLEETSTSGKHIQYHYQGDGQLAQYVDYSTNEVISYSYFADGQLSEKISSKGGDAKGWLREIDHYYYDELGRLIQVRRRNPEDIDNNHPDKDHALLSVDYDYDAVGNIRRAKVRANYTGYDPVDSEEYFLYDENDRMTVNKGVLANNTISINSSQGSSLSYDALGNISSADKYEYGALQHYEYQYNAENQLEVIQTNKKLTQTKQYDKAGRVIEERLFNNLGAAAQKNIMSYAHGVLAAQSSRDANDKEISKTNYSYDAAGNMTDLNMRVNAQGSASGYSLRHQYSYALWESYQQSVDTATQSIDKRPSTEGKSTRVYDVNGLLQESIDQKADEKNQSNSTRYWNSAVDGIKSRQDKTGRIHYLTLSGKTIGDLHLDPQGKQRLNVHGGFSPSGSSQQAPAQNAQRTAAFLNRAAGDIADGTLPESTQDNLGSYSVQAGDTLESISLQVYGDASLWYLLADANGINDKNAKASNNDSALHIGQRLTLPSLATGQHHTSKTHKVLNSNYFVGNTSATTPMPPAPPPLPKKHHGLFSKIVVSIIAVAATVLTAGIVGALAGATLQGAGGLFALGSAVLGGASTATTGITLAANFAAGFVGSIASQGVAKALGMQEGMSFKGALINGLANAATAGLLQGVNSTTAHKNIMSSLGELSEFKAFSVASAAQLMEQNALSQSINLPLQRHQHFDWEQLAAAGVTAGFMGSSIGRKLDKTLRTVDHNTGFLSSELRSFSQSGTEAAATGSHFDAKQVLSDNLGSAAGSGIVDLMSEKDWARLKLKELEAEDNEYCPIPSEQGTYSPIPEGTYEQFHVEADKAAYRDYIAQQLRGGEGYSSSSSEYLSTKQAQSLGNYERLSFESDLFKSGHNEKLERDGAHSEYSATLKPGAPAAWSNKAMRTSVWSEALDSDLSIFNSQLELFAAIPASKKIEFNSAPVLRESFDLKDAENGLRKVYDQYGKEMSKIIEKIYRLETGHFSSGQYHLTGTAGMEATKGSKAPYYGWSSEFFKEYPEYTPIGTTGLHDSVGFSAQGGNKQKKGVTQYIIFPSVEAGMLHLAYKIKNTFHGNYARWHAIEAPKQEAYRNGLKNISWSITKKFIKESK